jgi:hypothetical protein
MLVEGSQWFSPDNGQVGYYLKHMFENYDEWKVKGKRQGYYSRTNFSFEKMKEKLSEIFEKNVPSIPKQTELKLPSLKRVTLPKLSKI